MPDRSYTYRVIVDTSSARSQAAQIRRVFERELSNIQAQNVQLINPAALRNVQTAMQQQAQALRNAGTVALEIERQNTVAARTQSQERIQAARAEAQERINASRVAAQRQIEEERRITQQMQAEARNRQQASGGGLGAALGGALKGAAAGFLTVQGLRMVANYATESAKLDTQIRRTERAFVLMAGSTGQAEARLIAIQKAANGAVDRLTAMQIANQAAALKLAKTSEEFGNLARAAKLITFVSPTIKDINDALTQLSLFSSNEASFMRADQLGLSVREVKDRMAELRAENANLDGSTAKLLASIDILNQKYGPLLDSTEAQASGVEKLSVAWSEFINQKSGISATFDAIIGGAAAAIDELAVLTNFGSSRAILSLTESNAAAAKATAEFAKNIPFAGDGARRNAAAFQFAADMLAKLNEGVENSVPGAVEYRAQAEAIITVANRWGVVTDGQLEQLQQINDGYRVAAQAAQAYADANVGVADAQARAQAASEFGNTLGQFDSAVRQLGNVQFSGIEGIEDWRKELADLRSEFLQNGTLTDEQAARFEFLAKAASSNIAPSSALGQAMQDLGSSFLQNNEVAAEYVQQLLDLNAAQSAGKITAEQYAVGLEQIQSGLQQAADSAQFNFNAALTRSTQSIAQLDQLIASGTPGLTAWRDELTSLRDDIISTGTITEEQSLRIKALSNAINESATTQTDYGSIVGQLGDAFFKTNERAREITEQLNQLSTAYATGAINTDTYTSAANSLRNELDNIALNQTDISTEGLDQLGDAIDDLGNAVARGLPGADALIQQAIAMEQAIAASGGIVTADQAAQIDAWAAAADAAAVSADALATVQAAVGVEVATNDGIIAALLSSVAELTGEYNDGAISGDIFAGAMAVITERLYELLIAAGMTKVEVDNLIASLGAIPSIENAAGGLLGNRLGETITKSLQAQEEARKRREAERLARVQESAAKKSANAMESAMKRAAQEFENTLKKIPGLFGRSQVTDRQLKLAKAGVPQNFADDFLRRLEDEINQNADIWPDVSIEQAREALRKVGVNAVDDSKLAFEQLVEAWESGLLFSDKSNLELINADAVQAAIDLQEKTKQGQQNIIDHFKNVIGIAVDAATGVQVDTSGIGGTATTDKNIPDEITVTAPDDVQQVLASGNITISGATLSAVALQDIATQLATQAFAIQVSKVTISATATQTLSEQMLTDMGALKTKLETALQPSVKPVVTVTAEDYTTAKADLASALAPNITPNITLDAADILNANDIIAALTPNIHPTLSLTELEKTTFIGTVEALKPGINTRLFAGVTEMSDYILAVETDVKPSIATTLYATIEEITLFKQIIETTVKPTVSVALKLEETTDEQGNPVSSLPDIAGQFADAIDKQISGTSERFSQQGTDIAGYLALAAYNYSFPDVISRYADLIDFQIAANQERLGVQGGNMTSAIANGATTYVFPDVALTFVEAIEVQVRNNQERFMRQGTNAMNLIVQGMNGFDFSFIATAMISGVRAGMEQEAIKTALGDVGAGAMRTIRDGLENEAGNISWAGILTAAITESVLTELADSMEGQ